MKTETNNRTLTPHNESSLAAAKRRMKPYKVTRILQIGGERIVIYPISTEMEGLNVTTVYAQKDCPKKGGKHSHHSAKSRRILAALEQSLVPIAMPELSRIGSGKKDGWCASFSREISRLRAQGHNVVKVMDKKDGKTRQTAYQLNPASIE